MDQEEIDAIRARLDAANSDVWWELVRHDNPGGEINWQVWVHADPEGHGFNTSDLDCPKVREDAELVVNAPADIAALLAEVERLQRVEGEREAEIDDLVALRKDDARKRLLAPLSDEEAAGLKLVTKEGLDAALAEVAPGPRHGRKL